MDGFFFRIGKRQTNAMKTLPHGLFFVRRTTAETASPDGPKSVLNMLTGKMSATADSLGASCRHASPEFPLTATSEKIGWARNKLANSWRIRMLKKSFDQQHALD